MDRESPEESVARSTTKNVEEKPDAAHSPAEDSKKIKQEESPCSRDTSNSDQERKSDGSSTSARVKVEPEQDEEEGKLWCKKKI